MSVWLAVVLGVFQGLTEFLPISSTAHLRIVPALLGEPDPGAAFTAVVQLGSLAAVIAYFARDLFIDLPRAMFKAPKSPQGRLPLYLVLGTVPIVVAGLTLERFIVGEARSLWVIATTLAVLGAILIAVDARAERRGGTARPLGDVNLTDAVLIGLAQALALVPGVSRSGATITMALLLGFARPDAARFSFLLGIPALAGAGVFEVKDALAAPRVDAGVLVAGTIAAAIASYASIAWLMRWLGRRRLVVFGVYRIALAAVVVGLLAASVVAPDVGAH